jgi:hypothetical protein
MALRQPYSQTFSRIFEVVDTSSKKKARTSEIVPTMATKI